LPNGGDFNVWRSAVLGGMDVRGMQAAGGIGQARQSLEAAP
jgi:hypothetical protein